MMLLRHRLEPLYWVFETDFRSVALDGTSFRDWEERYDEIIVAQWPGARVAGPGFFPAYAKFVLPDWTELLGFTEAPGKPLLGRGGKVDLQAMARDAAFHASCIDAARWEMSSPNGAWLALLHSEFPAAQRIPLGYEAV